MTWQSTQVSPWPVQPSRPPARPTVEAEVGTVSGHAKLWAAGVATLTFFLTVSAYVVFAVPWTPQTVAFVPLFSGTLGSAAFLWQVAKGVNHRRVIQRAEAGLDRLGLPFDLNGDGHIGEPLEEHPPIIVYPHGARREVESEPEPPVASRVTPRQRDWYAFLTACYANGPSRSKMVVRPRQVLPGTGEKVTADRWADMMQDLETWGLARRDDSGAWEMAVPIETAMTSLSLNELWDAAGQPGRSVGQSVGRSGEGENDTNQP